MTELVEFLRARLSEDERAARAAAGAERADTWTTFPGSYGGVLDGTGSRSLAVGYGDVMAPATAEHIARHDPARVLAEVEAKRRALEHYERIRQYTADGQEEYVLAEGAVAKQVQFMALQYSNHPDYREEWKP